MEASDDYFDSILEEFYCTKEMEDVLNVEGEFAFLETDRSVRDRNRIMLAYLFVQEDKEEPKRKRKATKRTLKDRLAPWQFIEQWNEEMFYRQFRMTTRSKFYELLRKIIDNYPGPYAEGKRNYSYGCQQGDNAHGHHILLQIKLCITLRILAGASYLDMIWYGGS